MIDKTEPSLEVMSIMAKEMFAQCCMQFAEAITAAAKQPKTIKPIQVANGLYGAMGAVVTNIPDDIWEQMMDVRPCGNPDCDCHKSMGRWMSDLNRFRNDCKAFLSHRRGEQSHEM